MNDSIAEIEEQRLEVLERQAALFGPRTEPHILIELAELKHKNRAKSVRKAYVNNLDYDFLMDVMSATLIRFNVDQQKRKNRQLIHDIWMVVITLISFGTLIIVLTRL